MLAVPKKPRPPRDNLCEFYQTHTPDRNTNRSLSPYISLALYMDGPPHFRPRTKEEDLPPDADAITLSGELLEKFYDKVGLHSIWERHRDDYAAAMNRYHEPLAKMVFDTRDLSEAAFVAISRPRFTIYLDFMGSPNETDARNYGADYYVVVFPAPTLVGRPADLSSRWTRSGTPFFTTSSIPLASSHYTASSGWSRCCNR